MMLSEHMPPMRRIERVLETILYVDDIDAAERFYRDVLGLERYSKKEGLFVFFKGTDAMVLLFNPDSAAKNTAIPPHGAKGAGHVCFSMVEGELERWKAHLIAHDVEIEQDVTWPSGAKSFYFRDPAGNSLELASPKIWGFPEA